MQLSGAVTGDQKVLSGVLEILEGERVELEQMLDKAVQVKYHG